jgi:GTP-binding protein LepA
MQAQGRDDMDLEPGKGYYFIESHAIQMDYELNGQKYILNLIDTSRPCGFFLRGKPRTGSL